ncbi:Mitogen-activated protein kinase kinase kinase A [Durusdinium trenchii]|uniref:Mitogen-activated protein kinase kinase kinase A n=1 Tax=Durusdinium trenchii TaxID=1381693 RepID=A0ABP0K7I3_9DINO
MAQAWEDLELSLVKQTNGHSPSLPSDWARDGNGLSSSVRSPLVGQPEMEENQRAGAHAGCGCRAVRDALDRWYFFESGQWVVPISDYWTVNAMKCLSMLLTFFRVSGEFKDAAKLYRVLAHRPAVHMTLQQRILGTGAFLLQYIVAVVVVLMAIQLILTSTTPIATIGKLWVVFTTLDFDNYLCSFILFIFDCEHAFDWEVKLQCQSRRLSPEMRSRTWLLIYWAPVTVAVLCVALSLCFNICPLTVLHYGAVSNADPVLMLSSTFGLPEGCCSPQVTDQAENGVAVSAGRALVYYVVVPDGRPSPSSLQVMEGRGGDGNRGLRYGQVTATPLQMRWWLTRHGFDVSVYLAMRKSTAGGLALYQSSAMAGGFPHLAEWTIPDFPWTHRARIFVAAVNPSTGALSPAVVQSPVILRKADKTGLLPTLFAMRLSWLLPFGFWKAPVMGFGTWECAVMRVLADVMLLDVCLALGSLLAGPIQLFWPRHQVRGRDDDGVRAAAVPELNAYPAQIIAPDVKHWDGDRKLRAMFHALPELYPGDSPYGCDVCREGFGLTSDKSCEACAANCRRCGASGDREGAGCAECHQGFGLQGGRCFSCADQCEICVKTGPGQCDPDACAAGWTAAGPCCSKHRSGEDILIYWFVPSVDYLVCLSPSRFECWNAR